MPIEIDESDYPVVRVRVRGACSDAEYDTYHRRVLQLLRQADAGGVKMGVLTDGRESAGVTAGQRRAMVGFLEEHEALMKRASAGLAMVVSNAIQRGVLTAILWVRPIPSPHRVFSDVIEAERWLRAQIGRDEPRACSL